MTDSVIDPGTGQPRVLSRPCSTCVFLPGNKMDLRPGRLMDLIRGNTGASSHGLICHETLGYGGNPEFGAAYCHNFFVKYGHLCNLIRIFSRLGGFTYVDPPGNGEEPDG